MMQRRDLESKGCNVIDATSEVCSQDADYFTKNGTVLVDVIINLKMFRLNYYQPEIGVEYLEKYNVPVIKAIADYYSSPSEYNNSSFGMNPNSVPSQVNMPGNDGCIEGIWIGGRVKEPETERYYYAPHLPQGTLAREQGNRVGRTWQNPQPGQEGCCNLLQSRRREKQYRCKLS